MGNLKDPNCAKIQDPDPNINLFVSTTICTIYSYTDGGQILLDAITCVIFIDGGALTRIES